MDRGARRLQGEVSGDRRPGRCGDEDDGAGGATRGGTAAGARPAATGGPVPADVAALIPLVRRVVAARVPDRATEDDLVQETLARVLSAAHRVEPGMLEPYAIVTARNVVASLWRDVDRERRHRHRVLDLRPAD